MVEVCLIPSTCRWQVVLTSPNGRAQVYLCPSEAVARAFAARLRDRLSAAA